MINATIKVGKTKIKMSIPEAKEFQYNQFVELRYHANKAIDFMREHVEKETWASQRGGYLMIVATALSELTGVDINSIFELPKGDESKHFEEITKALNGNFDVEKVDETLLGLFQIATRQILKHKPKLHFEKDFEFKVEHDETVYNYTIPSMLKDALSGEALNPELETGRAIECYEIGRIYNGMISKAEKESTDEVSLIYQRDLFKMACVARRKDIPFPSSLSGIDSYINARAAELQNISMSTGRDILFFLNGSATILEKMEIMNGFISHLDKIDPNTLKQKNGAT